MLRECILRSPCRDENQNGVPQILLASWVSQTCKTTLLPSKFKVVSSTSGPLLCFRHNAPPRHQQMNRRPSSLPRRAKRARTTRSSSPHISLTDMPLDILSIILSKVPCVQHYSLSHLGSSIRAAVRELHIPHLTTLDLAAGTSLTYPPPSAPMNHSPLSDPSYLQLAGPALRVLRLPNTVNALVTARTLCRVIAYCHAITTLAFVDAGVVTTELATTLATTLPELVSLEVADVTTSLLQQLKLFKCVHTLMLPRLQLGRFNTLLQILSRRTRPPMLSKLSIDLVGDTTSLMNPPPKLSFDKVFTDLKKLPSLSSFSLRRVPGYSLDIRPLCTRVQKLYAEGGYLFASNCKVVLDFAHCHRHEEREFCADAEIVDSMVAINLRDANCLKGTVFHKFTHVRKLFLFSSIRDDNTVCWMPRDGEDEVLHWLAGEGKQVEELELVHLESTIMHFSNSLEFACRILEVLPTVRVLRVDHNMMEHDCGYPGNVLSNLENVEYIHLKHPGLTEKNRLSGNCRGALHHLRGFLGLLPLCCPRLKGVYMETGPQKLITADNRCNKDFMRVLQSLVTFNRARPEVNISTVRSQVERWIYEVSYGSGPPDCPYLR